jgi:putative toxin-antitoxin system antitoxin component (TIGR02293 family)
MAQSDERAIAALLGVPTKAGQPVKTAADLIAATRRGLPASAMDKLAAELELPSERVAAAAGVARRTLARRRGGVLKPDESDRLVRFAGLVVMARSVLGTREKARDWLSRPNRALAGQSPISLVDTDTGVRQVESALGRLAHGVHS